VRRTGFAVVLVSCLVGLLLVAAAQPVDRGARIGDPAFNLAGAGRTR